MKDTARLVAVIAVVVATAIGFSRLQQDKGYGLHVGSSAPAFQLPDLAGRPVVLEQMKGRWVLVNFWASWCAPCVQEMPSLERLHRTLGPAGLTVVGVSVDDDDLAMRQLLQKQGITFTVLRDQGAKVAESYRTTGYPETFLVNPQGVLVEKYVGPVEWDEPNALAHFRSLLGR
jgi:cytochrome c biogenesis protein CcmG/thiol:disulfide interchange protein DsbE